MKILNLTVIVEPGDKLHIKWPDDDKVYRVKKVMCWDD
jgi:hypothetical protein